MDSSYYEANQNISEEDEEGEEEEDSSSSDNNSNDTGGSSPDENYSYTHSSSSHSDSNQQSSRQAEDHRMETEEVEEGQEGPSEQQVGNHTDTMTSIDNVGLMDDVRNQSLSLSVDTQQMVQMFLQRAHYNDSSGVEQEETGEVEEDNEEPGEPVSVHSEQIRVNMVEGVAGMSEGQGSAPREVFIAEEVIEDDIRIEIDIDTNNLNMVNMENGENVGGTNMTMVTDNLSDLDEIATVS